MKGRRIFTAWLGILLLPSIAPTATADAEPLFSAPVVAGWSFESAAGGILPDTAANRHAGTIHGNPKPVAGVAGRALLFDGKNDYVTLPDAPELTFSDARFSVAAWANFHEVGRGQQMIVGKAHYAADQREWLLMLDRDDHFRFFTRTGDKWSTLGSTAVPTAGQWYHVAATIDRGAARLYVNGRMEGQAELAATLADTAAPLSIGAVNNGGTLMQLMHGAIDEVLITRNVIQQEEVQRMADKSPPPHETLRMKWDRQAAADAAHDRMTVIFDGTPPDTLVCDTTLRRLADGTWVMIMLGGGHTEPLPRNRLFITRSHDEGRTWSTLEPIDLGIKKQNPNTALVPSELMIRDERCTLFFLTHNGTFAEWKSWMTHSEDGCRTWSAPEPVPGRLHERTFIRNHIVTRDGRILLPFQHYNAVRPPKKVSKGRTMCHPVDSRNGVLISDDGGRTWTEHGDIRLTEDVDHHCWAENNIVELGDGRIAMIIRADGLGGVLYYAESTDGGRTWPDFARKTDIPNPGSKATLYRLDRDNVALLHNPNPKHRRPLSLWISFDGLQTWPYRRILVAESSDGPGGRLNYPDGFVSADGEFLHFAFDDNRHRAVYVSAKLPDLDAGQRIPQQKVTP